MEQSKENVSRMLMLLYFNRILRDNGVISQQDHRRLAHLIQEKYKFKR